MRMPALKIFIGIRVTKSAAGLLFKSGYFL